MKLLTTLKRRKRRFYKSLRLGAGVSILLSIGSYLGYLEIVEAKALDFLMLLRGQQRSRRSFYCRSTMMLSKNSASASRCREAIR